MCVHTRKFFLIAWLIIIFTQQPASLASYPSSEEAAWRQFGLQGKSFTITYSIDEEAYTDIITFEPDGSFSMAFFSQSEDSYGFYLDFLGIFFYAHLSGVIVFEPFSFSFCGIHLNPAIRGISIIDIGGSRYLSIFSGTETNQ